MAERRFPSGIRIGIPLDGFAPLTRGRLRRPVRGMLHDAVLIYFLDATLDDSIS